MSCAIEAYNSQTEWQSKFQFGIQLQLMTPQ